MDFSDDLCMLVDFDGIENYTSVEAQIQTLRDVKNDMIGSLDVKLEYFNKGLIETLMPMMKNRELAQNVRCEAFTVLNSFLFDFPKGFETFKLFREDLVTVIEQSMATSLPESNQLIAAITSSALPQR